MRIILATLVLLFTATIGASAASLDLGYTAQSTPYDGYMRPVRQVLGTLGEDSVTMARVRGLMREGRRFRYVFDDPYTAAYPAETAAARAGDCKDKALWLCEQINDESVRFVVGKTRRDSRLSHAWVLWKSEGRWWILDCTRMSRPVAADSMGRDEYVPHYSWAKGAVYRHAATQSQFAAIAGKRLEPAVASRGERR